MKLARIISGAAHALLLAAFPANAEIDGISLNRSNNEKSNYNLAQSYNSKLTASTLTKIDYSEKYSYSHDIVSNAHNAVSPYCTDISIQNSCYQYPDHSNLTPTEAGHLKAFNFARSYIPYLTNGKIDYLRNNFISGLISKATTNLTKETSKFLESFPFVLNASLDLGVSLDSDTTYGLSAIYNLSSSTFDDSPELKKSIIFGQTKVLGTTSSGSTWNIGVGGRKIINDTTMLGLNTFWDYRITPYDVSHSRFGVGGELFWKNLELRNNWYIAGTGPQDVTINSQQYEERVVPGWDFEIGYRLENIPELAVFARTFRWDYKYGNDNSGLELSANYQATPYINIEAYTSNEIPAYPGISKDNLNYDQWLFGLRFKFNMKPIFYKNNDNYREKFQTLMKQPVRRRYDVLLERKAKSSNTFSVSISGR